MQELAERMKRAGFDSVKTYIQSGNVVFRSSVSNANKLEKRIGEAVQESHGFERHIIVLRASVKQPSDAAHANPYSNAEAEPRSLYLFFLENIQKKANIDSLHQMKFHTESFSIIDKFYICTSLTVLGAQNLRMERKKLWV